MSKMSEVSVKVELDENQVPVEIKWSATDVKDQGERTSKAMMMAMWDKEEENSLRMDLWTTEMTIDEMKKFYHQSFSAMADSFERSTGEDGMSEAIRDFAAFFGEKLGILPPSGRFDR